MLMMVNGFGSARREGRLNLLDNKCISLAACLREQAALLVVVVMTWLKAQSFGFVEVNRSASCVGNVSLLKLIIVSLFCCVILFLYIHSW